MKDECVDVAVGGGVADQARGQRACTLIGCCNQVDEDGGGGGGGDELLPELIMAMRGFVAKSCFVSAL